MNIVIVGNGKVGSRLAEVLLKEDHDVTIVDNNPEVLKQSDSVMDVMTITGNGASARTLLEAGVDHADIFIAVMGKDELNMISSMMAKQLGAKFSIARVRSPDYTESISLVKENMGINMTINPEYDTAQEIAQLFMHPYGLEIQTFARGRVEMVEFLVEPRDKDIIGKPLRELKNVFGKVLCTICQRNGETIIPGGNFVIQPGDHLNVIGDLKTTTKFFKQLGRNTHRINNAMILGGGTIAYYLCKIVSGMGITTRVIENNPERVRELSKKLDGVLIIEGDGTDQSFLQAENIASMDTTVCLTNRDEENLLAGLFALNCGCKKVICKCNRKGYLDLLPGMGIDSVISPVQITTSSILRQVRARAQIRGSIVEKIHRVADGKVEAIEFKALEGADFLNIPLSALQIAPGIIIAVIVRNRSVIIPFGSDHIEANDTVILMSHTASITHLSDVLRK